VKKLVAVLIFILAGCASEGFPQSEGPALLEAAGFAAAAPDLYTVSRGTVEQLAVRHGVVRVDSVPLSFEISGNIAAVYVNEGDEVTQGQLLARLCTEDIDEQINQAEQHLADMIRSNAIEAEIFALNIALRHLDYNEAMSRAAAAFDAEAIRAADNILLEIERAELLHTHTAQTRQLDIADTRRNIAEISTLLHDTRLYAPTDGIITLITFPFTIYLHYSNEIFVKDLNTLLHVSLRDAPRIRAYINGLFYDLERITISMEEIARLQLLGELPRWRYEIIPPPCGTIPPIGAYASIVYTTLLSENTLRIPPNAVSTARDINTVYRITPNGEQELTFIRIGIVTDTYIEVLYGLEEGDVVLVR